MKLRVIAEIDDIINEPSMSDEDHDKMIYLIDEYCSANNNICLEFDTETGTVKGLKLDEVEVRYEKRE